MIETIRKHSKWLLYIIAGATIFTMVFYMGTGAVHSGNGGGVNTNEVGGDIYGKPVTQDMYDKMEKEVALELFFQYGEFPDQNPQFTPEVKQQYIYMRMMEAEKADQLGVHVTLDQVEQAVANYYLRSPTLQRAFGIHNESVPLNSFVNEALVPRGMTEDDFINFVHDDLAIQQVQTLYGLSGQLVTPQESTNEYIRENQEYSAQIIFFSASNFLSRVSVSSRDVGEFYTNYMANYRLPDRVQVSYVAFSLSNYLGKAESQLGSSNLDLQVQNVITKYGADAAPDATNEDQARAEIRNAIIRRQALQDAGTQADNFAQSVFNIQPASGQSLEVVAQQKGLTVEHPAPFSADYGPSEFTAPTAFTRTAFELSPQSPLSEPVAGPDAIYVIGYQASLPSEIPSLDQISDRVAEDLRLRLATITAERAGTNFAHQLPIQMASGKSFAAVGFADGLEPKVLPPFSLRTQDMPELEGHATANQLMEVALVTPPGTASPFMPTEDGGFILYVQSKLPVDEEKMAEDMPQFMAGFRQARENQAYSDWRQHEANRELLDTPIARKMR
jgi:SurA N-terminal domain